MGRLGRSEYKRQIVAKTINQAVAGVVGLAEEFFTSHLTAVTVCTAVTRVLGRA